MSKQSLLGKGVGVPAWTQPVPLPFNSTSNSAIKLYVPFKYYKVRSLVLTITAFTATGTDTIDLQGYDIDGGSANADMFTLTPVNIVLNKTYVFHVDASKCGYYTDGTALFTADTSLQIVPLDGNLFSTVNDANIPAENRGMFPYIAFGGSPTAVTSQGILFVDPLDTF